MNNEERLPHCTSCTCLSVWLPWSHLPDLRLRRSHWSIGLAGSRHDRGPLAAWLAVLGACQAVLSPKLAFWGGGAEIRAAAAETGRIHESLDRRPVHVSVCWIAYRQTGPLLPVLPQSLLSLWQCCLILTACQGL